MSSGLSLFSGQTVWFVTVRLNFPSRISLTNLWVCFKPDHLNSFQSTFVEFPDLNKKTTILLLMMDKTLKWNPRCNKPEWCFKDRYQPHRESEATFLAASLSRLRAEKIDGGAVTPSSHNTQWNLCRMTQAGHCCKPVCLNCCKITNQHWKCQYTAPMCKDTHESGVVTIAHRHTQWKWAEIKGGLISAHSSLCVSGLCPQAPLSGAAQ